MWPRFLERVEGVPKDQIAKTLRDDIRNGRNLYAANMDRAARPHGGRTDIPVQLIAIAGDNYVTPALLEGLEETAPNLHKRLVPGGHWLPRTHPDRVARWVSEFADHVDAGKRLRTGPLVVITGAGSGIGRATALAFAEREQGATVVAVDVDGWAAGRTAELARLLGAEAHDRTVDVGDGAAMEDLAKELIHEIGVPDIVVNNAGIGMAGPMLQTTVEEWQRILHVNLWGVIHGSRVWGRAMIDRGEGGHIVNVASAAAFTPSPMYPAYATTKAAVLMLTECLRAEVGDQGIGVTAICPGLVQTGIIAATRFVGLDDEQQEQRRRATDRFYRLVGITPDRVAAAIVDGVRRDRPLVPVGVDAVAARFLSRFAPGGARRLARF
jgi:NAD(P)-dependent dehydrogenase (short-subunit alcohol dehydrogenase family)